MFVSAEPNQQVEVERNPNYWRDGLPYLDGVIFRTIPDGTVQSLQVRTGEVDMLADTPLGEIGALQSAGLQIIGPAEGFNSGLYHFHTNTRPRSMVPMSGFGRQRALHLIERRVAQPVRLHASLVKPA